MGLRKIAPLKVCISHVGIIESGSLKIAFFCDHFKKFATLQIGSFKKRSRNIGFSKRSKPEC